MIPLERAMVIVEEEHHLPMTELVVSYVFGNGVMVVQGCTDGMNYEILLDHQDIKDEDTFIKDMIESVEYQLHEKHSYSFSKGKR